MAVHIAVNGALTTDVDLVSLSAGYVRPWECVVVEPIRHDGTSAVTLNDRLRVRLPDGTTVFRGTVTALAPGGVAREGRRWVAKGARWRLENEPVRINRRGFYVWNRRGHTCSDGDGGEDSPGQDGGKWTAGEIVLDILEHAFGVPFGGSDIAGHHSVTGCCTDTYLTDADVAGWTAADILALDSVVGEFSVDNTPVADAISLLLALNGGFYGWFVDPESRELVVHDLDTLPEVLIEAGELGQWQDSGGTDYELLDNSLEWSLDGVASTIVIQGSDGTTEEQPADIEGTGNAGSGDLGELEFVAAPWRGYDAAYRPRFQGKRHLTGRLIDTANALTPPDGWASFSNLPRIYQGKAGGPKTLYDPSSGIFPQFLLPSGIIAFHEDPRPLGYNQQLWAWYWAETPFTVTAGPDGDAYHWYGFERTRTVYDPAFRDGTSWPESGADDDSAAMATLAERLLRLYSNVRRQGTLVCDGVDFDDRHLEQRYGVENVGYWALEGNPAPTTTLAGGYRDPTRWDTLALNPVEITYDFERMRTEIRVANTFFMLEQYSELKRRLEMNLFAQRGLDLSEDLYECQSHSPVSHDSGEQNEDDAGDSAADEVGTREELEPAQADDWDRDETALRLRALTRLAYDHQGSQVLYAYYRDLAFDPDGRLVAVSAETRVTVDTPEAC
ncbi:MAG: hypothetical protein R6V05_09615 [Candidatus Brocadiia bacterium]